MDSINAETMTMYDDTVGHMLLAEAYPCDDECITLKVAHCEAPGKPYLFKSYLIRKNDAKALADNLAMILAAPDTQTALQRIADSIEEHDPD